MKPEEPKSTFVATVQIVVAATNHDAAGDQIADLLEGIQAEAEGVIDWSYLKVGQQYLYPAPLYKQPADYLAEVESDAQAVEELEVHLAPERSNGQILDLDPDGIG
jgi:hypothetical protein